MFHHHKKSVATPEDNTDGLKHTDQDPNKFRPRVAIEFHDDSADDLEV